MVDATQVMGWGWVGVGWGGDDNVPCTCTILHTWSVLRNIMFLALAHMVGATQVMGLGGVGVGWGGDDNVPCTCTHGRCYARNGMGWEIISYTLIVVCSLESEVFPKCL